MTETSGADRATPFGGGTNKPVALVLIGHAGDPRQWQCTAATQATCARSFVVDRVAWAGGNDLPPTAPVPADQQTGTAISPRMTLLEAAAAAGIGDELVAGVAMKGRDLATVDPRLRAAGDGIVWLLRSLEASVSGGGDESRGETVWLVDDATGSRLGSQPLATDEGYQPARLWPIATAHGLDCCSGDVEAFVRVVSDDGMVWQDGLITGGSSGTSDATTFGGGYGATPLVLPAGRYSVTSWLGSDAGAVAGPARDACTTHVTLTALDAVRLDAEFPAGRSCTFRLGPAPSATP